MDKSVINLFCEGARLTEGIYNVEWKNFDILSYARFNRFVVCMKGNEYAGFMLSRLTESVYDFETTVLIQDALYVKSGFRTGYLLLKDFLDFGKLRAKHIITMTYPQTKIKETSMNKYGFKKAETYYRLER